MTWRFTDGVNSTINVNPTTAAEAVYRLKSMLIAMGSIVAASGDGLSAFSLGTHPYTTHSDVITGYGTGAGGFNTLAWFIVRLPSNRMLLFQRQSTTNMYWRIRYIPRTTDVIPVPQLLSDGSSTVASTAPVQHELLYNSYQQMFPGEGSYRLNMAYEDSTYAFYVATWPRGVADSAYAGTGSGFLYDPLVGCVAEDQDPVVLYAGYNNIQYRPWRTNTLGYYESTYSYARAYLRRGMSEEKFGFIAALTYASRSSGNYFPIFPGAAGNNPHTGEDDGLPVVYARPVISGTPCGYKGISSVMKWTSFGYNNVGYALGPAKDRLVVGDVSLPWAGVDVLV